MEGQNFSFEFQITENDYKKFAGLRFRRIAWVLFILIPIYFFLLFMKLMYPSDHETFSSNFYLILLPLLFLFLIFIVKWIPIRTYRADPLIKKPRTIHFSEKGIHCITPNNNMVVEWNDISLFIERKKNFYFMLGFSQAIILPDHVFSSETEYASFKNFVAPVIGTKKKKGFSVVPIKFRIIFYGIIITALAGVFYFDLRSKTFFEKALKEYDKKNFKTAVEFFNQHVKKSGEESPALFKYRGYSYFGIQKFESAKNDFVKYSSQNKNDGEVYFFLGLSYLNLGITDSACVNFFKSDSLKYPDAKNMTGKYCLQ